MIYTISDRLPWIMESNCIFLQNIYIHIIIAIIRFHLGIYYNIYNYLLYITNLHKNLSCEFLLTMLNSITLSIILLVINNLMDNLY